MQGKEDLENRTLRHVGPAFIEDPFEFFAECSSSPFHFKATEETVRICRSMSMVDLPSEEFMKNGRKLIIKGDNPSAGLNFLKDTGWIQNFP